MFSYNCTAIAVQLLLYYRCTAIAAQRKADDKQPAGETDRETDRELDKEIPPPHYPK